MSSTSIASSSIDNLSECKDFVEDEELYSSSSFMAPMPKSPVASDLALDNGSSYFSSSSSIKGSSYYFS